MRIAIMGGGAVGGYFGGMLSRAGNDVTFIARGAHLAAMQANGLTLDTPKGKLEVRNARFVAEPGDAGTCDVVLFAVKANDIESAAMPLHITPHRIEPNTSQNGASSRRTPAPPAAS